MRKIRIGNTAMIAAAFLLCGLLHVLLYGADFAELFSQLYCGAVIAVWGISVRTRVTDRRLQRLLLVLAACLLLLLLLQTVNYRFAQDREMLRRYAWYGYYAAEMAAAVLFYYSSYYCGRESEAGSPAVFHLLPAAGCLTALGIVTNDLHSLAFSFLSEEKYPGSPKTYGPLYYLFFILLFILPFAAFAITARKHRTVRDKKRWFLPLPLLVMTLLFFLDRLGRTPQIGGIKIWQMGEAYCFCAMAFLELCIGFGMIPANSGYSEMFRLTGNGAVILDESGAVRYAYQDAAYPFADNENTIVREHPVSGGKVVWQADVGELRRLNRELEETADRIEARNDYLSSETQIKKEIAEMETRRRIYDEITLALRPQLDRIRTIMEDSEEDFDERLPDVAVLAAYAKRRCNMELLAEGGSLPLEELSLAISESLSYVRLKGVGTALSAAGSGSYPAGMLIRAYELLEMIIEDALDTLVAMAVTLKAGAGEISLRIMLNAASFTIPAAVGEGGAYAPEVSVTKEGQDLIFFCLFREEVTA